MISNASALAFSVFISACFLSESNFSCFSFFNCFAASTMAFGQHHNVKQQLVIRSWHLLSFFESFSESFSDFPDLEEIPAHCSKF